MANWGIDINADKTEFWLIARPDKKSHNMTRRDVEIRVEEGKSIRPSNQLKYLLVTFQPHGQFTKGERIGGGVASRRLLSDKSLNHQARSNCCGKEIIIFTYKYT